MSAAFVTVLRPRFLPAVAAPADGAPAAEDDDAEGSWRLAEQDVDARMGPMPPADTGADEEGPLSAL